MVKLQFVCDGCGTEGEVFVGQTENVEIARRLPPTWVCEIAETGLCRFLCASCEVKRVTVLTEAELLAEIDTLLHYSSCFDGTPSLQARRMAATLRQLLPADAGRAGRTYGIKPIVLSARLDCAAEVAP